MLILDDPPGLSPEATEAIADWVRAGGVAVALFGPRAVQAPLGATLRPFSEAPIRWEALQEPSDKEKAAKDANETPEVASLNWGGVVPRDLATLRPVGRALLAPEPSAIKGRWSDGPPFLSVAESGRGLLIATSLPSSPDVSDFSLRPGFLALLRAAIDAAKERRGDRESGVGVPWFVVSDEAPTVFGPAGPVEAIAAGASSDCVGDCADVGLWQITPELAGRYEFETSAGPQTRIARLSDVEVLTLPTDGVEQNDPNLATLGNQRTLNLSDWIALVLVGLLGAEIAFRIARLVVDRREVAASERGAEL